MLKLVQTADGSNTIFNETVGENYHSRNGALQESRHVFVEAGLNYFLQQCNAAKVSILEVGFGTGLNFLLTADACIQREVKLSYMGIEAHPLTHELISQTGYEQYVSADTWREFIEAYPNPMRSDIIDLEIASCPLLEFNSDHRFDIVYFDAFAAAHQPEMWNEGAISHTAKFVKPNGVFVTYAITGNLKRMLKSLGFTIQKIPGAAGKREMLRAIRFEE